MARVLKQSPPPLEEQGFTKISKVDDPQTAELLTLAYSFRIHEAKTLPFSTFVPRNFLLIELISLFTHFGSGKKEKICWDGG